MTDITHIFICTTSQLVSESKQGVKPVSETLAYVDQIMWPSVKENIAGRTFLITPV
jgi:hypothetical protein